MPVTSGREVEARTAGAPGALSAVWGRLRGMAHSSGVHDLRTAVRDGDTRRLATLLHPAVGVVLDAGHDANTTITAVRGPERAIPLLLRGLGEQPGLLITERSVNGQAGLMLSLGGQLIGLVAVDFAGRMISMIWIRLHPAQLRRWNAV